MRRWAALQLQWSFVLFFFLLSTVGLSATDLKVRTTIKITGMSFERPRISQWEETVYVQGTRERREHLVPPIGDTEQPHSAEILDCASRQAYRVDLNGREYVELIVPPFPSQEGTDKRIIQQEKKARKSFDVRTVEAIDTKVFFGRTARHVVTTVVGKTSSQLSEATIDAWYLDLPLPGCSPAYLRQGRAIEVTSSFLTDRQSHVVYTGFLPPGLAVQETVTIRSRFQWQGFPREIVTVVEKSVEEISDSPLDPALFVAPAGFTKVDQLSPTLNVPRPALLRR